MGQFNTAYGYATIEPVARHIWGFETEKYVDQFSKIFDVESTDQPIMETLETGGPGILGQKQENAPVKAGNVLVGTPKRWTAATFAGSLQISHEALNDTKLKEIKTASSALGRATALTPEYLTAQFLDRAFDTNYPATWDGLPLCSTAHLRADGTTYANAPTVNSSLSESSVEDIKTAARQTTGTDGLLRPMQIKAFVVPSALVNLAEKLSKSEKTLGSANNDPSVVQSVVKGFLPFDFLTSQTRYFALTSFPDGLFFKYRERPQFIRDNSPSVMTSVFLAYFRAYWGCENPRAIYGVNAA